MSTIRLLKRSLTTKVAVDEQCLPLKPVWSIQSLLQTKSEPITDDEFQHLLTLARIRIEDKREKQKLKREIDNLTEFTENIKHFNIHDSIQPLTHIWKQDTSQILREDKVQKQEGRELLKLASKKSGHFYVVKGTMPSS